MKASGPDGELRVGYQQAASLGAWSLDVMPTVPMSKFVVDALVRTTDAFWQTQEPLTLDLRFGRFHWIWEPVRASFDNGHVSVCVFGKPRIVKE